MEQSPRWQGNFKNQFQNNYLETQILLPEDNLQILPGATVSGQIIFTPKLDLAVAKLGFHVVMQLEGKLTQNSKNIAYVIFFRNKKIKEGKVFSYDIEFTISSSSSYSGKNANVIFKIETLVELSTRSYLQVRNEYLKSNQLSYFNPFDPNLLLSQKTIIQVLESESPYTVELKSEIIEMSPILAGSIFGGGTFGMALISGFLKLNHQFEIILATSGILFVTTLAPYFYKNNILNSIKVDTKPLGENQFIVLLDLTRNWKRIRKVSVNYEVFEEVKDRRNKDSVVKYNSKIYSSSSVEKHKVKMDKNDILDFPEITYDFIFDFPTENIPTSIAFYDLKLYWKINITVYFLGGLKSTFTKNIDVKREIKP